MNRNKKWMQILRNSANPAALEILRCCWLFLTCCRHHYFIDIYRGLRFAAEKKMQNQRRKEKRAARTNENSRKTFKQQIDWIEPLNEISVYSYRIGRFDILYARR